MENRAEIAAVHSELEAAELAMAKAKGTLAKLQAKVADALDVDWYLYVQLLVGDDGPYAFVPEDALGSKPTTKKDGGKIERKDRIYDFSAGHWTTNVKPVAELNKRDENGKVVYGLDGEPIKVPNPYHGHDQAWSVTHDADGFHVTLAWDDQTVTITDADNMNAAAKKCKAVYHEAITGDAIDPKTITINLMTMIGDKALPYVYA